MAERPCHWGVLCIRPKSSLCSCRYCQWFCAEPARHQRRRRYSPGKKNKDQLAGLAGLNLLCRTVRHNKFNNLNKHTPGRFCTEHVYVAKSAFFEGVGHLRRIFHRQGIVAHQPLLVSENDSDCHLVWYKNIRSASLRFVTIHAYDRRTELRQQYHALHYMQSHGKMNKTLQRMKCSHVECG